MTLEDIALTLIPGLGDMGIDHLLSVMGDARAVYAASEEELVGHAQLNRDVARNIIRRISHRDAEKELRHLERNSLTAVASTDNDYPAMLRECRDRPHVLYVMGDTGALCGRMLAVVGTRTITPYGQRMYDVLVGRLSELAPRTTIVSGLASGGDANAHRAALDYGLPTVAVVANSLPGVTPSDNRRLADEILASGGAVVSELHSQFRQNGRLHVRRNRIVAGMCEGAVVVESPVAGGSMTTAEYAYGYNRTLMAVPGRSDDRCSMGCNLLVRHRKAALVCSGDDVLHELGWDITEAGCVPRAPAAMPILNVDEKRLVNCFGAGESVDMDTLALRSGMSVGETAATLLGLEIGGVVRALPGKTYELI